MRRERWCVEARVGAWICPITRHNFARMLTHDKKMPTIKGDEIAPAEIDRRAGMPSAD